MVRTIYLHAGLPKTGTTAIQSALAKSSKVLRAEGILFPAFEENHSLPLRAFADADLRRDSRADSRVQHNADLTAARTDRWRAALNTALRESDWDGLVLSGEGISILPRARLETLRDRLGVHGDRIEVILMLRHPFFLRVSQIQQSLKGGGIIAEEIQKQAATGYFRQVVSRLAAVFGTENLRVVIYDEAVAATGGLLGTFAGLIGADPELMDAKGRQKNPRMSGLACGVLDRFNRDVPTYRDGRRSRKRSLWVDRAIRRLPGEPFALSAAEADVLRLAVEDDRDFADAWLGRQVWTTGVPSGLSDASGREPSAAMMATLKLASRVLR